MLVNVFQVTKYYYYYFCFEVSQPQPTYHRH